MSWAPLINPLSAQAAGVLHPLQYPEMLLMTPGQLTQDETFQGLMETRRGLVGARQGGGTVQGPMLMCMNN